MFSIFFTKFKTVILDTLFFAVVVYGAVAVTLAYLAKDLTGPITQVISVFVLSVTSSLI